MLTSYGKLPYIYKIPGKEHTYDNPHHYNIPADIFLRINVQNWLNLEVLTDPP